MTDVTTILILLALIPIDMLGTSYIVVWLLKKRAPEIIAWIMKQPPVQEAVNPPKKKWKW